VAGPAPSDLPRDLAGPVLVDVGSRRRCRRRRRRRGSAPRRCVASVVEDAELLAVDRDRAALRPAGECAGDAVSQVVGDQHDLGARRDGRNAPRRVQRRVAQIDGAGDWQADRAGRLGVKPFTCTLSVVPFVQRRLPVARSAVLPTGAPGASVLVLRPRGSRCRRWFRPAQGGRVADRPRRRWPRCCRH